MIWSPRFYSQNGGGSFCVKISFHPRLNDDGVLQNEGEQVAKQQQQQPNESRILVYTLDL